MATLQFLDPPRAPDQSQRERRPEDDLRAARVERLVRLVLSALGIAGLAAFALVVTASVSMMTSKQEWLSSLRAQYAVESVTLVDGPGRADAIDCWTGSTVHLVARIKNEKVELPTASTVTVTLSGGLDAAMRPRTIEQSIVLPGSATPRVGNTVEVPFTVDVPAWMSDSTLVWTVQATGSGDEPPNRGYRKMTILPCAQRG
jgi:hypothetical protein